MSKMLILALALLSQPLFAAGELNCEVTKVYDSNVFEEGLSTHEYPDVTISKRDVSACPLCPAFVPEFSVDVGAYSTWTDKVDGMSVRPVYNTGKVVGVTVKSKNWNLKIDLASNHKSFTLSSFDRDEKEFSRVAKGKCKKSGSF